MVDAAIPTIMATFWTLGLSYLSILHGICNMLMLKLFMPNANLQHFGVQAFHFAWYMP
jgi:hypothetical protein